MTAKNLIEGVDTEMTPIEWSATMIWAAKKVVTETQWVEWADKWLSGQDRSEASAEEEDHRWHQFSSHIRKKKNCLLIEAQNLRWGGNDFVVLSSDALEDETNVRIFNAAYRIGRVAADRFLRMKAEALELVAVKYDIASNAAAAAALTAEPFDKYGEIYAKDLEDWMLSDFSSLGVDVDLGEVEIQVGEFFHSQLRPLSGGSL